MPLRVASYLSAELPPLAYITSVRALLLRDNMVMTVRDAGGTTHLLPGGRREEGETLEQTLRREIREETGWSISDFMPLGFLHYHHEAAVPKNYAYPYPDFVQAVYAAQAEGYDEAGREPDGHELDVRFRTFDDALRMPISLGNRVFLRAVMSGGPRDRRPSK